MSNRFHNKFHRQNHHSDPTVGYPDSAFDPIASFEQPFKGEFYSQGDIITTQNLSAGVNLNVTNNANIFGTSVRTPNIGTGEDNSVVVLNASGYLKTDEINPGVWDTTMKFVSASDGALTVNRLTKATDAAGINESIVFDNGTNVGIGTDTPGAKLTISGTLSTSGTATIGTIADNTTGTSVVIESGGLLQKRTLNVAAFNTISRFVSASDGDLTINRLPKATDSNGINESIIYDDGINVGVGTDTPTEKLHVQGNAVITGTVETANIGTGEDNSVVILDVTGKLRTDEINPAVWNTSMGIVSADDKDLDAGYIPKAINALGLDKSIIFESGSGNIGIGTASPNEKLTVSGNLSASGTATIGTIADNATGTSVVIETAGLLQKRTLNAAAFDTTSKFVSASDGTLSVNYLTKATDAAGINESIVFDNGTNVGISEASPKGKFHVKAGSSGTTAVEPNSIGIFENSGNSYISILSPTAQYAGVVMGGPTNPYGSYVSWNHDNLALKVATNHAGGSIQLLAGTEQEAARITAAGNVGIGTTSPSEKLTVKGNLSASGTATIGTIPTNDINTSFVVESNGLLQKRTLNIAAGNTVARFVSASDGALSINHLTKATDSNGINESIISDDGASAYVGGNLTISGNLTALGNSYFLNTLFTTTSAISVVNTGPGPALYVYQGPGTSDVASFYDGDGVEVLHIGNCDPGDQFGKIGINTGDPNKELTVKGSVSASGTMNLGTVNTNASSTSFVVLGTDNILQKRSINSAATDTTSRFVSASDGDLSVNYLTKATNSNGINESIVYDDGTKVGIGTASPQGRLDVNDNTNSSLYAMVRNVNGGNGAHAGIAIGNDANWNKFIIFTNSSNRTADGGAGNTTLRTDSGKLLLGAGGVTYHALDTNGNVGIGTTTPSEKLDISGNVKTSGTATIGTLNTGTSDSIIVESSGLLQKRTIDSRAWGSSLVDGSGTTNYVAKWSDSDTITNSIVFDNGTNVGIGTTSPLQKFTVNGTSGFVDVMSLSSYITRTSTSGNSVWMQQDGTGRNHWYWNTFGGTLPVFTNAGEDASALTIHINNDGRGGSFFHRSASGVGKNAGDAISWITTIYSDLSSFTWKGNTVWHSGNDGTGSGLDADLLDGQSGSYYTDIPSRLGFTPVQQGGGTNQGTNKLYIGWSAGSQLRLQVDVTDFGADWPINITGMHKPGTLSVIPAATTTLPSSNDVVLNNQTGPVTITAFSNGVAGVTYTITNKSTHAVTLDTSASLFVRGGNSWASHKCTTNSEGYLVLPQNFSCSLRMDSATIGSVW